MLRGRLQPSTSHCKHHRDMSRWPFSEQRAVCTENDRESLTDDWTQKHIPGRKKPKVCVERRRRKGRFLRVSGSTTDPSWKATRASRYILDGPDRADGDSSISRISHLPNEAHLSHFSLFRKRKKERKRSLASIDRGRWQPEYEIPCRVHSLDTTPSILGPLLPCHSIYVQNAQFSDRRTRSSQNSPVQFNALVRDAKRASSHRLCPTFSLLHTASGKRHVHPGHPILPHTLEQHVSAFGWQS